MKIKKLVIRIPFWLFCISMAISLFAGVAYPEETKFWIVKNAYPIIIFEFLGLFTTVFLLGFRIYKNLIAIGFVLFGSITIACYFAIEYNIWLIPYFLISIIVKYIASKKIESIFKISKIVDDAMIYGIPFLLSAFIALMFSSTFYTVFSRQINLIFEVEKEILVKNNYSEVGLSFIVLWGIIYFISTFLFDIAKMVYESKYRKNADIDRDHT